MSDISETTMWSACVLTTGVGVHGWGEAADRLTTDISQTSKALDSSYPIVSEAETLAKNLSGQAQTLNR